MGAGKDIGVFSPRSADPCLWGGYQLLGPLGKGALAEVYAARPVADEARSGLVAIKRILPDIACDDEVLHVFFKEAARAQQLVHSNICRIHGLEHRDEAHFVVMEHIWGRNLGQLLTRLRCQNQLMPLPTALHLAAAVCRALEHARRECGLVHRGLMPANVCLAYSGAIKVTDFGVDRAVGFLLRGRTRAQKRRYAYMAPEEVRGRGVGFASDLFSLGTMLYELLTNEQPFTGGNDFATLDRIRRADCVRPTRLRPALPAALEEIVMTALARDPQTRWPSAEAMHQALAETSREVGNEPDAEGLSRWLAALFPAEIAADRARFSAALPAA